MKIKVGFKTRDAAGRGSVWSVNHEYPNTSYVEELFVTTASGEDLLRIPFMLTDDGMYVRREPYADPSYATQDPYFTSGNRSLQEAIALLRREHKNTDLGITISVILEALAHVLGGSDSERASGEIVDGSVGGDSDGDTDHP